MTNQDRSRLLDELKGDRCFCGKRKQRLNAFCRKHFSSLSPKVQKALIQRFGSGYEEAYVEARSHFAKVAAEAA